MWGRGLKSDLTKIQLNKDVVAPRVGAWIEIRETFHYVWGRTVAPRVGAWIEIVPEISDIT